jgi:hypothetical protein
MPYGRWTPIHERGPAVVHRWLSANVLVDCSLQDGRPPVAFDSRPPRQYACAPARGGSDRDPLRLGPCFGKRTSIASATVQGHAGSKRHFAGGLPCACVRREHPWPRTDRDMTRDIAIRRFQARSSCQKRPRRLKDPEPHLFGQGVWGKRLGVLGTPGATAGTLPTAPVAWELAWVVRPLAPVVAHVLKRNDFADRVKSRL